MKYRQTKKREKKKKHLKTLKKKKEKKKKKFKLDSCFPILVVERYHCFFLSFLF